MRRLQRRVPPPSSSTILDHVLADQQIPEVDVSLSILRRIKGRIQVYLVVSSFNSYHEFFKHRAHACMAAEQWQLVEELSGNYC